MSESTWNAHHIDERTEVLYNPDEIVRRVNGPSMFVIPNHPVSKTYLDMNNRGVKIRFISEITKDNLGYCKALMKIAEVRHLDEVKGNFGIGDKRIYHGGRRDYNEFHIN